MLNHIKKVLNSIGLALQDVLLVVPMLTIYSAYLIKVHKIRDRLARIITDKGYWEPFADDTLGIRFNLPGHFHVTHTTNPISPDMIIISDMELTQHEEPVKESILYRPKYGGVGGGYEHNETPIYKGIMITIDRNSIDSYKGKTNQYESIFKKYWYEGKNITKMVAVDKNTYHIMASYLNIPEYETLYKEVINSISLL